MHERLRKIIARETDAKSFRAKKYQLDDAPCETQDEAVRVWKYPAEYPPRSKYIDLSQRSEALSRSGEQRLTYFLDGSRRIFKIDDAVYGRSIYPVMAGQVSVGCCRRKDRRLAPERSVFEIVIALPDIADPDGRTPGFFPAMAQKLNERLSLTHKGLEIASVLQYKAGSDDPEEKAIACIQTRMLEREKELTEHISRKLNHKNYLVKDGSLEYRRLSGSKLQNYRWVLGVSKSFNPKLCKNVQGRDDPAYIANLPVNHRTQAACFIGHSMLGEAEFAVWYIRLRESRRSAFDGIIKVEKMLLTQDERASRSLSSDEIDTLSAYILNERCPVSYGKDSRWASHIYPVFMTESFIKSRYISSETFLSLF